MRFHAGVWVSLLFAAAVLPAGCFDDSDDRPEICRGPLDRPAIDAAAPLARWVVDAVQMPATARAANQFGLNLDGDEEGRPDNGLGQVLSTVYSQIESSLDDKVAAMIASGQLLHLMEVQAGSLDDASGVGVRVFLGEDLDGDPTDNFSGTERFDVAPGNPVRPMTGTIMGGRLRADRGVLPLAIGLPGLDEPFVLELTAARVEAEIEGDRMTGVIAGALTEEQVQEVLIPFVHRALANSVSIDCDASGCVPGSQGELYLELFDADDDGEISLAEVRFNSLVEALLAPDVDLFDADRENRPRCDGIRESLSVGVGFSAVPAEFASPLR